MHPEEKEDPVGTEDSAATEAPKEAPTPEARPPSSPPEPVEDWATRFKYLLAEFDNYRKRAEREREVAQREATASFLRRLLPVYEAFLKARESVEKLPAEDPLRKGLDLVHREWEAIFEREGFGPVARPGEPFDSMVHEAVADAPASAHRTEGSIVDVVQQGYRFKGGLLRPAKVTVARAPPKRPRAKAPKEADDPKSPEAPPPAQEES